MALLALLLACLSLGLVLWLAARQLSLEGRLLAAAPAQARLTEAVETSKPLEGLRVALDIRQDAERPVFADLLRERLLKEDVAEIVTCDASPDVVIQGEVVCNGYSEVYFQAKLTCSTAHEEICSLSQRPPDGDRPDNLCLELVSKLTEGLEKLIRRNERRNALRELSSGG